MESSCWWPILRHGVRKADDDDDDDRIRDGRERKDKSKAVAPWLLSRRRCLCTAPAASDSHSACHGLLSASLGLLGNLAGTH